MVVAVAEGVCRWMDARLLRSRYVSGWSDGRPLYTARRYASGGLRGCPTLLTSITSVTCCDRCDGSDGVEDARETRAYRRLSSHIGGFQMVLLPDPPGAYSWERYEHGNQQHSGRCVGRGSLPNSPGVARRFLPRRGLWREELLWPPFSSGGPHLSHESPDRTMVASRGSANTAIPVAVGVRP